MQTKSSKSYPLLYRTVNLPDSDSKSYRIFAVIGSVLPRMLCRYRILRFPICSFQQGRIYPGSSTLTGSKLVVVFFVRGRWGNLSVIMETFDTERGILRFPNCLCWGFDGKREKIFVKNLIDGWHTNTQTPTTTTTNARVSEVRKRKLKNVAKRMYPTIMFSIVFRRSKWGLGL